MQPTFLAVATAAPRTSIALCCLLASAAGGMLAAQSTTTSPKGYETTLTGGGANYSNYFANYADMRYQMIDANLVGTRMIVTQLAMRQDDVKLGPESEARTYQKVTIRAFHSDAANPSTTFANNMLDQPVVVVNGVQMSFPDWSGPPTVTPAPFNLKFPFTTPFVYDGKRHIGLEFLLEGGTLKSSAPWSGTQQKGYYAAGLTSPTLGGGAARNVGAQSCVDSAQTQGAYGYAYLAAFVKYTGWGVESNKLLIRPDCSYAAPNAPVAIAISNTAATPGFNIGVPCNNLYLQPILVVNGVTDAGGRYFTKAYFPYDTWLIGATLAGQAAWLDSSTGQLMLSQAREYSAPRQPAMPTEAVRYYHHDVNSPTAITVASNTYIQYVPLLEYTYTPY